MTADELTAAKAELNELDTTAADLRRAVDEGIAAARAINAKVRECQQKLRPLEERGNAIRAALKKHEQAEAARLRAEAEAKAKEAAEAKRKAAETKAKKG
jgi:chromosome segregation ATPase